MFLLQVLKAGQLNPLGTADVVFFILCGVVVASIIAIYFLIPVFKRKTLEEQRNALRTREKAFKAARNIKAAEPEVKDEAIQEEKEESIKEE